MTKSLLQLILIAFPIAIALGQQKGATPLAPGPGAASAKSTYAVVVGISDYQDPVIPDLLFADKDAQAFANYLRSDAGGRLDADHLKVLTNEQATAGKVAAALYWLVDESRENDQVIIYFSGHGDVERKFVGQPGFLLCWDSPPNVYMGGGSVELGMLQSVISTLSIENKARVLFIADACHSGKLAGASIKGSQVTHANLARQFANEVKILSCQSNEYSLEGKQWGGGRGAFSYHLVNGLYGLANQDGDDRVSLKELGRYLEDRVSVETAPEKQNPVVLGDREVHISRVDPQVLAELRKGTNGQMPRFSAFENRGLEVEVLSALDTSVQRLYRLFQEKLESRSFFEPANDCAEVYYNRLRSEPGLVRLHNSMSRSYAAALQDNSQRHINAMLNEDIWLSYFGPEGLQTKYLPSVRELEKAASLLGAKHYMHAPLLARKYFFEAYLLFLDCQIRKSLEAGQILEKLRASLNYQSNSPVVLNLMAKVFTFSESQNDSGRYYAIKAIEEVPGWSFPYKYLAMGIKDSLQLLQVMNMLEGMASIDSSMHPALKLEIAWHFKNWRVSKSDHEELERKLLELIRKEPAYTNANLMLSRIYIALRRPAEAEAILSVDSTHLNLLDGLTVLYGNTREHGKNLGVAFRMIALDSTYPLAWNNLGWTYLFMKQYEQAESSFKKAIYLDAFSSVPIDGLGRVYFSTKRYREAEMTYKRGLLMGSNYWPLWYNLANVYDANKQYNAAVSAYKEAIALDSTRANVWRGLSSMYIAMGRYAEAVTVQRKIVSLDSISAVSWIDLGATYVYLGDYAMAEPILKKAITLDTSLAQAYKHLGMIYLNTQRQTEARQVFSRALTLDPDYPGSYLGMACLVSTEQGTSNEAMGYVETAIQKGSTFEQLESDQALHALRALPEWKRLMKQYFPDQEKR